LHFDFCILNLFIILLLNWLDSAHYIMFQGLSTQQFLEISEIRKGVVILKNKALRSILLVSSVNFALKSEIEQDAIVYQFQTFLNSLDFPIQIFIQSQRLNITRYLHRIEQAKERQKNKLLKSEAAEYQKLIQNIVGTGVIMNKSFYVIVPFEFSVGAKGLKIRDTFLTSLVGQQRIPEKHFERFRNQLTQRTDFVAAGLRKCGIHTIVLGTREITELYWSVYNPQEAEVGFYPEMPPELIVS